MFEIVAYNEDMGEHLRTYSEPVNGSYADAKFVLSVAADAYAKKILSMTTRDRVQINPLPYSTDTLGGFVVEWTVPNEDMHFARVVVIEKVSA